MRSAIATAGVALVFGLLLAAGQEAPSNNLKSRADSAQGAESIAPSLDYAHQQLEYANRLYTEGDVDKAEAAVAEVLTYCQRATQAAAASKKKLKQTEIDLRKLEHRTRDIGRSLNIDDRPPLEKVVQELEQLRASLLAQMFGLKTEPKDKTQ